jgi:hypothetical protein
MSRFLVLMVVLEDDYHPMICMRVCGGYLDRTASVSLSGKAAGASSFLPSFLALREQGDEEVWK